MLILLKSIFITTITMSFTAFIYGFIYKIVSKKNYSKWFFYTWIAILVMFLFVYRPVLKVSLNIPYTNPIRFSQEILSSLAGYSTIGAVGDPDNRYTKLLFIIWILGIIGTFFLFLYQYKRKTKRKDGRISEEGCLKRHLWIPTIEIMVVSINWFNPFIYFLVKKINSEYQKDARRMVTNRETRSFQTICGITIFTGIVIFSILLGIILQSYQSFLYNYYEQKWKSNYSVYSLIFIEEKEESYEAGGQMGSIKIQYDFRNSESFVQEVSAYDTLLLNQVDLTNQLEADTFANKILADYQENTNELLHSSNYHYKITLPENLNQYSIYDFIRQEERHFGMNYVITYQQNDLFYSVPVTMEHQNLEGISQLAQESILDWAESMSITLPEDYPDYITGKRADELILK